MGGSNGWVTAVSFIPADLEWQLGSSPVGILRSEWRSLSQYGYNVRRTQWGLLVSCIKML